MGRAPDADLGEIVIAYVVAEPGSAEPSEIEARFQRAAGLADQVAGDAAFLEAHQ